MEIIETEVMNTEKPDYQSQNANELFAYFTNTLNIKKMENMLKGGKGRMKEFHLNKEFAKNSVFIAGRITNNTSLQ